jgi:ABC-type transport system involved in multi-copper enzyme maturation permease subunit
MTALLVLVLILAPMIFKPSARTDALPVIDGTTVSAHNSYFSVNIKPERDQSLTDRVIIAEDILSNPARNVVYDNILSYFVRPVVDTINPVTLKDFYGKFEGIMGTLPLDITSVRTELESAVLGMKNSANTLSNKYSETVTSITPLVLVSKETNEQIRSVLEGLIQRLNVFSAGVQDRIDYINLRANLIDFGYIRDLDTHFVNVKNIEYDNQMLQQIYEDYYVGVPAHLTDLNNEILALALGVPSDPAAQAQGKIDIDEKIWAYAALSKNTTRILDNAIMLSAAAGKSDAEMSGYIGFENFNNYQRTEELTKYKFLFDNDKAEYDYANVFAFGRNSDFYTNAYDFIYFVLEIFAFVIIAYGVVLGAGMIAGEQSSGTIKLLAIRPYNRGKIMCSKMMAAFFFVTLFTVLSTIIAIIASLFIYGTGALASLPVLVIFNATLPFTLNAWVLLLIYLAALIIKAWIFVLLAFAISTLFKSHVGAVIISVLLYLISMVITFVAAGANWLKYVIFSNLDFFKYFGGSFINQYRSGETFTNLFINPVFADTTIIYTSVVVVGLLLLLNIITFATFKHRDIT